MFKQFSFKALVSRNFKRLLWVLTKYFCLFNIWKMIIYIHSYIDTYIHNYIHIYLCICTYIYIYNRQSKKTGSTHFRNKTVTFQSVFKNLEKTLKEREARNIGYSSHWIKQLSFIKKKLCGVHEYVASYTVISLPQKKKGNQRQFSGFTSLEKN